MHKPRCVGSSSRGRFSTRRSRRKRKRRCLREVKRFTNTATQIIDATWSVGQVDAQGVAAGHAADEADSHDDRRSDDRRDRLGVDRCPAGTGRHSAPAIKALAKARFDMRMNPLGADPGSRSVAGDAGRAEVATQRAADGQSVQQGEPGQHDQAGCSRRCRSSRCRRGANGRTRRKRLLPQVGKLVSVTTMTYMGPEQVGGKHAGTYRHGRDNGVPAGCHAP